MSTSIHISSLQIHTLLNCFYLLLSCCACLLNPICHNLINGYTLIAAHTYACMYVFFLEVFERFPSLLAAVPLESWCQIRRFPHYKAIKEMTTRHKNQIKCNAMTIVGTLVVVVVVGAGVVPATRRCSCRYDDILAAFRNIKHTSNYYDRKSMTKKTDKISSCHSCSLGLYPHPCHAYNFSSSLDC